MEYSKMQNEISSLCRGYRHIAECRLLSRLPEIPIMRVGKGKAAVLFIGEDELSAEILLRFARELCEEGTAGKSVFGVRCDYLLSSRSYFLIPLLPGGAMSAALDFMNGGNISCAVWFVPGEKCVLSKEEDKKGALAARLIGYPLITGEEGSDLLRVSTNGTAAMAYGELRRLLFRFPLCFIDRR